MSILTPSPLELARAVCPAETEIQAPPVQNSAVIGTRRWPFIASSSTELSLPAPLLVRPDPAEGLGYEDEWEQDRDRDGALWARVGTDLSGAGTVENSIPHPYRQRTLMEQLLCQVCTGGPERDERERYLFVVPDGPPARSAQPASWAERAREATPPVCLADAVESAAGCPRLGRATALWVRRPVLYGVAGFGYRRLDGTLRRLKKPVSYEDPALAWVVAHQMVRRLEEVIVDWELTEYLRSLHTAAWPTPQRSSLRLAPAAEISAMRDSCPVASAPAGGHRLALSEGVRS